MRPSSQGYKTCFQMFSPHQVKTPSGKVEARVFHGIEQDRYGAATAYHIETAARDQKKSFGRQTSHRVARYIVYSPLAWQAMRAHEEREAIRYHRDPLLSPTAFFSYADIQFMGNSMGGQYRHWVTSAQYVDHTGAEVDVLAPGEILIVSKGGFDAQRIFRTVTSDNRETLPDGVNFFVYDDLEAEYKRKCRSFDPWIEEYHLTIPANVNGAALVRVVPEDFKACVPCETCAEPETPEPAPEPEPTPEPEVTP